MARAHAIRIWTYSLIGGGLIGGFAGVSFGGSIVWGVVGAVVCTAVVGGVASAVTGGAGWVMSRIHAPSGRSTPGRRDYSRPESLAVRGRFDDAIRAYEVFVLEEPEEPVPYLRIARLLRDEMDRAEAAIRWFKRARREARMSPSQERLVTREIVEIYRRRTGEPLKAAPELARLAERFPGTSDGEWARGELHEVKALIDDEEEPGA